MGDIAKNLGQRIRQYRCDARMSQEELAFKASISPSHLGQIERAVKHPTVDTVEKIAAALDVSVTELFSDGKASLSQSNPTVEKINTLLASMTEDEQKDILRIIRIFKGFRQTQSNR